MVSLSQLIQETKNTYKNDELCNVTGWDFYMEMFREELRLNGFRPYDSWKFYPVTVFKGERIVMIIFEKEDEEKLKKFIEKTVYNKYIVLNGSNPFL